MERLWRVFQREVKVSFEEKVRRVLDCRAEEQQWVQSWLEELLRDLLQEDLSFPSVSLDYGPCLSLCLEASFFHQLISVLSAVFPRSLLPVLYSFFASLWLSMRLQPIIAHEHFSQATLRLFTHAIATWPPEEDRETTELIALLRAVCERLEACPAYEGLFIVQSGAGNCVFVLLDLVEKMVAHVSCWAISEHVLTAVRCCLLPEDPNTLEACITSQLGAVLCGKMWELVDFSLPSFNTDSSPLAETRLMQIAACLDSVFAQSFSPALITNLQKDLFTHFFLPLRPVLDRGHWKAKIALLRLLGEMGKLVTSEHFTSLFSYFLSEIEPFSPTFSHFSWENRSFWSCLNCGKEEIRVLSLQLLYILIGKMHWKVLYPLFPDELLNSQLNYYCSPEELFEMLPGALICNFRDADFRLIHENCISAIRCSVPEVPFEGIEAGESLLIEHFLGKLERIWDNSSQENVLITGILANLCLFPGYTPAARSLHRRLLGDSKGTRSRSLFTVLRAVRQQADFRQGAKHLLPCGRRAVVAIKSGLFPAWGLGAGALCAGEG